MIMKNQFILTTFLVTSLGAFTLQAEQDLLGHLPATTVAGSSTNSGTGSGIIGWKPGAEAVFQLSLASTNYAGTAVTVDLSISDNGVDWLTNQIALACTPLGQFATNTATAISRQTNSSGAQWLQVGQLRNPNTNAITFQRFSVSVYNPR